METYYSMYCASCIVRDKEKKKKCSSCLVSAYQGWVKYLALLKKSVNVGYNGTHITNLMCLAPLLTEINEFK